MRRESITSGLLLIACVVALMTPLIFPRLYSDRISDWDISSRSNGRWIVDSGMIVAQPKTETGENKINYVSEDGRLIFSHDLGGFSARKFVSNKQYIYGFVHRTEKTPSFRGDYKVIKCDYAGRCEFDNLFGEGVFDIAAGEDGYYVLTYRFKNYLGGGLVSYPRGAKLFHVSDAGMSPVCCEASIDPISVAYEPSAGLTLAAIVGGGKGADKFSFLKLSAGSVSTLFSVELGRLADPENQKAFEYFASCSNLHIMTTNLYCILPYFDGSKRDYYFDIKEYGASLDVSGRVKSLAFPKFVQGRGVKYLTEDGKFAVLDNGHEAH